MSSIKSLSLYFSLDENQLIYAPALEPSEVIHDEQALANECFTKVEHPMHGTIRLISNPVKLSRTPAEVREPAPRWGSIRKRFFWITDIPGKILPGSRMTG